jgi:hypothetical protein
LLDYYISVSVLKSGMKRTLTIAERIERCVRRSIED